MFAMNGPEALLTVLWLIGVVFAVANYGRGHRGLSGVALIAVAFVVPVLGSLAAIAVFVLNARGGVVRRGDHPVTG
jgi:hypothetical protein